MRVTLEECKYILLPNKLFSGVEAGFLLDFTHKVTQVLSSKAPYTYPFIDFSYFTYHQAMSFLSDFLLWNCKHESRKKHLFVRQGDNESQYCSIPLSVLITNTTHSL